MNWLRWGGVIVLFLSIWIYFEWPDEKLHLVFCDVGQGDSAIVLKKNFQALIDTGPSWDRLDKCLSDHLPFWDRKIELVFISHPQKDHNGALKDLKNAYRVSSVVESVWIGDTYRFGNIYFDILSGAEYDNNSKVLGASDENEVSQVIKLRYGDFSALFTGDIGEKTELALDGEGVLEEVDVLKVPHHGSKYSSSKSFLESLRPDVAVVSVGEKNSYGHPSGDSLIRLDMVGAKVLRTDKLGTIEVVSDGVLNHELRIMNHAAFR